MRQSFSWHFLLHAFKNPLLSGLKCFLILIVYSPTEWTNFVDIWCVLCSAQLKFPTHAHAATLTNTHIYMYLCLTGYPVLSCIATFRLTVQCYFPLALSIWLYILQIVIRALLREPLVVVVVFHVDTSVVIAPTLQTLWKSLKVFTHYCKNISHTDTHEYLYTSECVCMCIVSIHTLTIHRYLGVITVC